MERNWMPRELFMAAVNQFGGNFIDLYLIHEGEMTAKYIEKMSLAQLAELRADHPESLFIHKSNQEGGIIVEVYELLPTSIADAERANV